MHILWEALPGVQGGMDEGIKAKMGKETKGKFRTAKYYQGWKWLIIMSSSFFQTSEHKRRSFGMFLLMLYLHLVAQNRILGTKEKLAVLPMPVSQT